MNEKNYELELTEKEVIRIKQLAQAFALCESKNKDKIPSDENLKDISKLRFRFKSAVRAIELHGNSIYPASCSESSRRRIISNIREKLEQAEDFYKKYKDTVDLSDLDKVLFPLSDKQTFNRL